MFANRKGHRGNVIIVTVVACILAAARTWGAESPGGRPQARGGTTLPAGPEADDLALILRRLKVDFVNPNSQYPEVARGVNYSRAPQWLSSLAADGQWPDVRYEPRPALTKSEYANPATPNRYSNAHLAGWARWPPPMPTRPARTITRKRYAMGPCGRSSIGSTKIVPARTNGGRTPSVMPQLLSRILVPLEDVLPAELMRHCLSLLRCPFGKRPLVFPRRAFVPATTTGSRRAHAFGRRRRGGQRNHAEHTPRPDRRRHSARLQFSPARPATL